MTDEQDDPFLKRLYVYSSKLNDMSKEPKTKEQFNVMDIYTETFSNDDIEWLTHTPDSSNLITSLDYADVKRRYIDTGEKDLSYTISHFHNYGHYPVIDIDVPCELVPSSRVGHYHLFIHKRISTPQYAKILRALEVAGIVEAGYVASFFNRGFSAVRTTNIPKPGVPKVEENLLKKLAEAQHRNSILENKIARLEEELKKLKPTSEAELVSV